MILMSSVLPRYSGSPKTLIPLPKEGFRFGPFKTYQVPVKRIEELANLKFSKAIRDADVFSAGEINEMIATARYIEINSEEDIVLTAKGRRNRR